MSKKINKKYLVPLIIVFLVLFTSIGLRNLYEKIDIKVSNRILNKTENGGISATPSLKFFNENNESIGGILLEMKPGEEFSSSLIVKNNYDKDIRAHFETVDFKKNNNNEDKEYEEIQFLGQKMYKKEDKAEVKTSGIEIKIVNDPGDFILKAGQIREFDYTIGVPQKIAEGTYEKGDLSVIESAIKETLYEGNLTYITFGASIPIKITITKNPKEYKTEQKLPKKIKEIVMDEFKQKVILYSGFVFFIIALVFVYLGFKAKDKK